MRDPITEPDDQVKPSAPRRSIPIFPAVRAGVALLAAIAAITTWFVAAPTEPEPVAATSHASAIASVLSSQELNESFADSAPQQTVVNTWATVDLLEIVATQLDDLAELSAQAQAAHPADPRLTALLLILIVAGALIVAADPRLLARPSTAG